MRLLFIAALLAACGSKDSAQASPISATPTASQARTEDEPDVNTFQHKLRSSAVTVRAQVLSTATETLQTDGTRHVETYDVLEVFHQQQGSAVAVGDDVRVDLGRAPNSANTAPVGEELVLFLAGPFDYVDVAGVSQSWYRLAGWPIGDTPEPDDRHARWFKMSYATQGDYVGGRGRFYLVDERRLETHATFNLCCSDAFEVDSNGRKRPDQTQIDDRALTWSAFVDLVREAAAAEGA